MSEPSQKCDNNAIFKQNYTQKLFISFKISYSCCFGFRENLEFPDFLQKKFYNIDYRKDDFCVFAWTNLLLDRNNNWKHDSFVSNCTYLYYLTAITNIKHKFLKQNRDTAQQAFKLITIIEGPKHKTEGTDWIRKYDNFTKLK